ncbi:hypothetical protein BGX33_010088 [Mortierella sp. NVP41]|nr:hypothetical protein BGX33_010088 [Mortierella sp. NVP41]
MRAQGMQDQLRAVMNTTTSLAIPLLATLLLLLLPSSTSAQVVAPVPSYQLEYTSYPDKTLYIRGGLNQGRFVPQFYSLDLTPLLSHSGKLTWKKLNHMGGSTDFRSKMPMTVNRLNQAVTIFLETGDRNVDYNLMTDKWDLEYQICGMVNSTAFLKNSLRPTFNPKTGLTYIPHAFAGGKQMLVYDADLNKCSGLPMPPDHGDGFNGYGIAWSASKDTMYLFSNTAPPERPGLWEFQPTANAWKLIPIQGDTPPVLSDNCVVSALGGQKVIVFGGYSDAGISGIIYIFDTTTYKWTKGTPSPSVREQMACAAAGDYFVFWGGSDLNGGNSSPAEISFYNVRTDKWVNQADIAPPSATPSTGSAAPGSTSTTGSGGSIGTGTSDPNAAPKSNAAAIGGGIAGVVVVVAIVGFLFIRRRKRTESKRVGSPEIPLNGTGTAATGGRPGDKSDAPLLSTPLTITTHHQHDSPPPMAPTTYPEPAAAAGQYDIYANSYAHAASVPASYPPPPSTPYTDASSLSPYTVAGSMSPFRDSLATYVDPSSGYAIQGTPYAEPTIAAFSQEKVEKTHVMGGPQGSPPPPSSNGGRYADTHGYGASPIPTSPSVATAAWPTPPPPIPSRPQLYSTPPQHQQKNQSSYNNPQYISPSALALQEQEFSQLPPTTRNPQTHQGSSTNNKDNNFDSITDPLQKLTLMQAKHEENMERMRQEQANQQAELERLRRHLEQQKSGRS